MLALSFWRPWPWAILHLPEGVAKRVENRNGKPWGNAIGPPIALHASKRFDDKVTWDFIKRVGGVVCPPMDAHPYGIVGVLTITGFYLADHPDLFSPRSPWAFGPVCWKLANVRALPEPAFCKGAQGFFDLPSDVEAQVRSQLTGYP
jgi:hypothetical protein